MPRKYRRRAKEDLIHYRGGIVGPVQKISHFYTFPAWYPSSLAKTADFTGIGREIETFGLY
jgi:hypothetical protein